MIKQSALFLIFNIFLFFHPLLFANPYWDPQHVPKDNYYPKTLVPFSKIHSLKIIQNEQGINILRIQVEWLGTQESYVIKKMIVEPSGTPALIANSKIKSLFGSYLGILKDNKTGFPFSYYSIGTGKEYRKLARAITLRFPLPTQNSIFELYAENPITGKMEKVVTQVINLKKLEFIPQEKIAGLEIRELSLASKSPSLRVNIYAEGYFESEKDIFWQHAMKTVQVLRNTKFPGVEYMSFYGIFHPSNKKLGNPRELGEPVPEYDSFLGLFYPYWDKFGRWYDVVYPTQEDKFRRGLALSPYDYPIILVNSTGYWGVGNYMSHTAIPAANSLYFTYLLLHEFGHFFGLNEEYEGGGRTELEFAQDIAEPWSQNITFSIKNYDSLKWKTFVNPQILLPTPYSMWKPKPPIYGAYIGGYADSKSTKGRSHKPGLGCVMDRYQYFCDICQEAIKMEVKKNLG